MQGVEVGEKSVAVFIVEYGESVVNVPPASHNRQSLSRSCKANIRPEQLHKSAIDQHLLDNAQCAFHYNNEKFFILARGRSSLHLSALEVNFH